VGLDVDVRFRRAREPDHDGDAPLIKAKIVTEGERPDDPTRTRTCTSAVFVIPTSSRIPAA